MCNRRWTFVHGKESFKEVKIVKIYVLKFYKNQALDVRQ